MLNAGLLVSALGHLAALGPMANQGTGGRWVLQGWGGGCCTIAGRGRLGGDRPLAPPSLSSRYLPLLVGTWAAAFAASLVGLSSSATSKRL